MGIYPETRYSEARAKDGQPVQMVVTTSTPGFKRSVVFVPFAVIEERTDCFCCSCYDHGDSGYHPDPDCRNHGWDGRRPCALHDLPGLADEDGVMPKPVHPGGDPNVAF